MSNMSVDFFNIEVNTDQDSTYNQPNLKKKNLMQARRGSYQKMGQHDPEKLMANFDPTPNRQIQQKIDYFYMSFPDQKYTISKSMKFIDDGSALVQSLQRCLIDFKNVLSEADKLYIQQAIDSVRVKDPNINWKKIYNLIMDKNPRPLQNIQNQFKKQKKIEDGTFQKEFKQLIKKKRHKQIVGSKNQQFGLLSGYLDNTGIMDQILKLEQNIKSSSDGSHCTCEHDDHPPAQKKKKKKIKIIKKIPKKQKTVVVQEDSKSLEDTSELQSEFSTSEARWAAIERRQRKREMQMKQKKEDFKKKGIFGLTHQQKPLYYHLKSNQTKLEHRKCSPSMIQRSENITAIRKTQKFYLTSNTQQSQIDENSREKNSTESLNTESELDESSFRSFDNSFKQKSPFKRKSQNREVRLTQMFTNPHFANANLIMPSSPKTYKFLQARSGQYNSLLNYIEKTKGVRRVKNSDLNMHIENFSQCLSPVSSRTAQTMVMRSPKSPVDLSQKFKASHLSNRLVNQSYDIGKLRPKSSNFFTRNIPQIKTNNTTEVDAENAIHGGKLFSHTQTVRPSRMIMREPFPTLSHDGSVCRDIMTPKANSQLKTQKDLNNQRLTTKTMISCSLNSPKMLSTSISNPSSLSILSNQKNLHLKKVEQIKAAMEKQRQNNLTQQPSTQNFLKYVK